MVGLVACRDVPWETDVIGHRTASVGSLIVRPDADGKSEALDGLLAGVIERAAAEGTEYLSCKVHADDAPAIHALERQGFLLMDTLLDYVCDLAGEGAVGLAAPPLPQGAVLRPAEESDRDELMAVARACFRDYFGRVHSDERIPRDRATRMYEQWIPASYGGWADWMLVAELDGRIAGYSIWRRPQALEERLGIPLGHYSIGAVHPDFSGRGLFRALTGAGMRLFDGLARYLEGPTHAANLPVQRAYARLGWRIGDVRHSFHRWLAD
jgi:ribosomal protein S18 acetylase RimI-like enzyme